MEGTRQRWGVGGGEKTGHFSMPLLCLRQHFQVAMIPQLFHGNPSLCAALLRSSETIFFLCPAILKGDNGFLLISGLLLYLLFVPLVLPRHMK